MDETRRTPRSLRAAIAVVLALLLLGLYLHYRPDPLVRKAQALQQALAPGSSLTPEQRQEKRELLRDIFQAMTPEQRRAATQEGRKRFEQEMIRYAKMSRQEKDQFLDQRIAQINQFRGQGPPPPNRNFGSGPPPGANRSPEDRERRRREMLDSTTPEFRAGMDQFRHDMAQRMGQHGGAMGGRR